MSRNPRKIIRSVTVPQSISFFEEVISKMAKDNYEIIIVTSPGKELEEFRQRYPQQKSIEVRMERHISLYKDLKSLWNMIKIMSL